MTRSEARVKAMTILYQININNDNHIPYKLDEIISENNIEKESFINDLVDGVLNKNEELDKLANNYLKDWKITRLDKLGAIILKMAFYEIKYSDTPNIVAIDEAINLAKKYCDEELAKMINATLDKYLKKERKEVD